MRKTIEQIQKKISAALKDTDVYTAFLFGSYAEGTEDDRSDLDILLIAPSSKPFIHRYEDYPHLFSAFPDISIDLIIYTPEELERNRERPFIHQILTKGKILYECLQKQK